jgi:hypothetical protein
MSARALSISLLAVWAATLAGALTALAGLHILAARAPHDALPTSVGTGLELFAHNAPVALWPLALVAIGWPALPAARLLGDLLIAGQLLAHGLLVGSQLGQHPGTWRYLPHLPFEWLAIAIPAAAWLRARTRRARTPDGDDGVGLVGPLAACIAALAAGAAIETYLVPVT